MEESTAPTAVVAQPRTIVIERRWAIVGSAVIAAVIIALGVALGVALAIVAGDHGPRRSAGISSSRRTRALRPGSRRRARADRGAHGRAGDPAGPGRAAARIRIRRRRFQHRLVARVVVVAQTRTERPLRSAGWSRPAPAFGPVV